MLVNKWPLLADNELMLVNKGPVLADKGLMLGSEPQGVFDSRGGNPTPLCASCKKPSLNKGFLGQITSTD
jgi:hypothetical protein